MNKCLCPILRVFIRQIFITSSAHSSTLGPTWAACFINTPECRTYLFNILLGLVDLNLRLRVHAIEHGTGRTPLANCPNPHIACSDRRSQGHEQRPETPEKSLPVLVAASRDPKPGNGSGSCARGGSSSRRQASPSERVWAHDEAISRSY